MNAVRHTMQFSITIGLDPTKSDPVFNFKILVILVYWLNTIFYATTVRGTELGYIKNCTTMKYHKKENCANKFILKKPVKLNS